MNVFNASDTGSIIDRINRLTADSQPQWGKMSADQMLAHLNVPYQYTFEPGKFARPGLVKRFFLRTFIRPLVVGPKPYARNGRTAPEFLITGRRNFDEEKIKLIDNIRKTQELGEKHFDGLENISFGVMTAAEWNTLYYKHLDHHLSQFGV